MDNLTFANPGLLYLLLLLVPLTGWYIWREKGAFATIQISSTKSLEGEGLTIRHLLRHVIFAFRLLVIALVIIVLARPQSTNKWQNVSTEGIDIILALDISSSMLAQDLRPNRLEASKDVAIEFISGRATAPIVTTDDSPEPTIAAKAVQALMVATASPPDIRPTHL